MGQACDERRHHQRPDDGSEPIAARLGSVAALVGLDGRLRRDHGLRHVRLGLGDEPTHRRAAYVAAGSTERMGAETLGPSVQRRVRGRVPLAQPPRHVPQAPAAGRVRRHEVLDRRQAEPLPRQHVARQHPDPAATPSAPRQRDRGDHGQQLEHAKGVSLEKHEPALHPRLRQHQTPAGDPALVIGGSRDHQGSGDWTSTAPRTRDTKLEW
jgi:hypothetical protein